MGRRLPGCCRRRRVHRRAHRSVPARRRPTGRVAAARRRSRRRPASPPPPIRSRGSGASASFDVPRPLRGRTVHHAVARTASGSRWTQRRAVVGSGTARLVRRPGVRRSPSRRPRRRRHRGLGRHGRVRTTAWFLTLVSDVRSTDERTATTAGSARSFPSKVALPVRRRLRRTGRRRSRRRVDEQGRGVYSGRTGFRSPPCRSESRSRAGRHDRSGRPTRA